MSTLATAEAFLKRGLRSPALVLAVTSIVFAWIITDAGLQGLACAGIDWADHLGAIESFVLDQSREPAGSLGDAMLGYPPFAHWLCSRVVLLTGIAPPRALQLFCATAGFIGCVLIGLKVVRLVEQVSASRKYRLLALLVVVSSYAALTYLGIGLFGHLAYNFFYAQFIATVAALIALEGLRRHRGSLLVASCYVQLVGCAIVCTHLLPALWFYGSAVLAIALRANRLAFSVMCFVLNALFAILLLVFNPYFRSMANVSTNDGDFVLRTGIFSSQPALIAIVVTSVALTLLLLWLSWKRQGFPGLRLVAHHNSGMIAIVGLIALNTVVFLLSGLSSWYSIKKYLMILAIDAPLASASLIAFIGQRRTANHNSLAEPVAAPTNVRTRYFSLVGIVALLVVVQIPWGFWNFDQQWLLYYRDLLLPKRFQYSLTERAYPSLLRLSPLANYYLATGVIVVPRDDRTLAWLQAVIANLATGESTVDLSRARLPSQFYWHTMQVQRRNGTTSINVHWPYASHFVHAQTLPSKMEEVLVGCQVIDGAGKIIREERTLLRPRGPFSETDFTAAVPPEFSDAGSTLKIGLVQEGVTWFEQIHPGESVRILLPLKQSD